MPRLRRTFAGMASKSLAVYALAAALAACTAPPPRPDAPACLPATPGDEAVLLRYRQEPFALRQIGKYRHYSASVLQSDHRTVVPIRVRPVGSKLELTYEYTVPWERTAGTLTDVTIYDERGVYDAAATARRTNDAADADAMPNIYRELLRAQVELPELPADPLILGVPVRSVRQGLLYTSKPEPVEIRTTAILRSLDTRDGQRVAVVDIASAAYTAPWVHYRGVPSVDRSASITDCTLAFAVDAGLPLRWTCHRHVRSDEFDSLYPDQPRHGSSTTVLDNTYEPA